MRVQQLIGGVLVIAACGGSEPSGPSLPGLVQPLAQADVSPWRQQVWFTARPGETIERLSLTSGSDAKPVVTLVARDGSRRALTLIGPNESAPAQVTVRPDAAPRRTASTPDGGMRATVDMGELVSITVTDTRKGGGRRVVLRDIPSRRIEDPVMGPDGSGLFFREQSDLGGIYRVSLVEDGVQRIVPEQSARFPHVWPTDRGERVVYVEGGAQDRVVVAVPLGTTPPRPAAEVLAEGRFPRGIVPVVASFDGSPVRVGSCEAQPGVTFTPTGSGVVKVEGSSYPGFESAQFCGRGCSELLGRSPEGALRVAAVFHQEARGGVWDVWFDGDVGATSGSFADAERVDDLLEVPGCLPPHSGDAWIVEPRYTAPPGFELLYFVQPQDVGGVPDVLRIFGRSRGRPFLVKLRHEVPAYRNWVLNERAAPPEIASTGDAQVAVKDGGIVWTEKATGASSMVLPPDPTRVLRHPVLSDDGALLWVIDDGDAPGLRRISVEQGTTQNVLPWSGLHHPLPMAPVAGNRVAWLRKVDDRWLAGTSRPWTPGLEAAWNAGPITLLDFHAEWVPVRVDEGKMVRCEADDLVRFGVDAEGGFVAWGPTRVPARAAVMDEEVLLLLGEHEGVPAVLAELRVDGDRATWWPRALQAPRTAGRWAPASQAMHLPVVSACDPDRD